MFKNNFVMKNWRRRKSFNKLKENAPSIPMPPSKNVSKIQQMLVQVQEWENSGDKDLARKHWDLISEECKKYGEGNIK